ncbi:unnamed protein product [Microthlaspi erraticum]|uniref:DUF8039 domain-containing protein n=1 Tax=Microthlaspi erraticum TaxID=1685480 RepID=A0A6D2JK43_9BRAS|nr:unnamed protein product [Microthlaspi erraticum]
MVISSGRVELISRRLPSSSQACAVELNPCTKSFLAPHVPIAPKCKLLNWLTTDEEPVAEGRWQTRDPKALVNGLPLGPNAIKVFVDVVLDPDTFIWRPTEELSILQHSLKTFVAWPVGRVVMVDDFCNIPVCGEA